MTGSGSAARGLRVVVLGATGNVGSSLVRALSADATVESVLGLARREPADWPVAKTTWATVDIGVGDRAEQQLTEHFRGADAVVHLAWLIQPTHDPARTWRTNVQGTAHVLRAVAAARVPALVYASSVGAYSPGPKHTPVDETWPTHGWPQAAYSREKAYVERLLDIFERDNTDTRVVRMRPGFIFKPESAAQQRRIFARPLLPNRLLRSGAVPMVPDVPGMRFQVLHSKDAAEAYRLAVTLPVQGAFNLAAEPSVDAAMLARLLGTRAVRMPRPVLRAAVAAGWHSHLTPASPHLFDLLMRVPLLDCARAAGELGWSPRHGAELTLDSFLDGMRRGAGMETPPLAPRLPHGRLDEFATGVGSRP